MYTIDISNIISLLMGNNWSNELLMMRFLMQADVNQN